MGARCRGHFEKSRFGDTARPSRAVHRDESDLSRFDATNKLKRPGNVPALARPKNTLDAEIFQESREKAAIIAWADHDHKTAGKKPRIGEDMERHHLDITEKTVRLMNLRPGERVLDLGCGSGWATRLLARLVGDGPEGFGQVVGVDVSDEMVRQARQASKDFENILYVWGSAQQIPWEENFFDKVLSVESFYYYADQDRALMELFRVMAPRGRLT